MGWSLLGVACASAGAPDVPAPDAKQFLDAAVVHVDAPLKPVDAAPLVDAVSTLCVSTTTCEASAVDLGTINGDTDLQSVTATGYLPGWYKIRVHENDGGFFGVPMSITASLTSPANAQYGVFVYLASDINSVECTTASGTETSTGTVDTVGLEWGETGVFSNGDTDDRTVSIEVRELSGTCAAASPWSLVVTGDSF